MSVTPGGKKVASGSHLDLDREPYVVYGVNYINLVSLYVLAGQHHPAPAQSADLVSLHVLAGQHHPAPAQSAEAAPATAHAPGKSSTDKNQFICNVLWGPGTRNR